MGGDSVPDEWQGKIPGVKYNLGGAMKDGYKVRLSTHNTFATVKSSNVIGYIRGSVEPDRYVFLSNHRDAWGYGSVDPSSGTAQLMEVARSFGELLKKGWRPRRTIVLASWAAEESGLEGSYEWVYHHTAKLMHRTVGLVNTDMCVSGPIAKPQASPVLKDIVVKALKMADDPTANHPNGRKYYEFWEEWTNKVRRPYLQCGPKSNVLITPCNFELTFQKLVYIWNVRSKVHRFISILKSTFDYGPPCIAL